MLITCLFVTGGRHFTDGGQIHRDIAAMTAFAPREHGLTKLCVAQGGLGLDQFDKKKRPKVIESADALAWVATHQLDLIDGTCAVDHELDGPWPAAGPRRNRRMLDSRKPQAGLSYPQRDAKNAGTWGCTGAALSRGIPVAVWAPGRWIEARPSERSWVLLERQRQQMAVIFRWRLGMAAAGARMPGEAWVSAGHIEPRLAQVPIMGHVLLVPPGTPAGDAANLIEKLSGK